MYAGWRKSRTSEDPQNTVIMRGGIYAIVGGGTRFRPSTVYLYIHIYYYIDMSLTTIPQEANARPTKPKETLDPKPPSDREYHYAGDQAAF